MTSPVLHQYHPLEEQMNAYTHALGALLAVIGTVLLLLKAHALNVDASTALSNAAWLSLLVYGCSLTLLFSSSSIYHFSRNEQKRFWLKKLDHCAIYYLIAGTYTPFLVIAMPSPKAQMTLLILWGVALLGTIFKLCFIHRFQKVSLLAYLVMGWAAVFFIQDMREQLSAPILTLMIAGGLCYTVGALFYTLKQVRYTHAIWHVFVLAGAAAHFFAIYAYVI